MTSIHELRFIRARKDAVYFDPDVLEYGIARTADIDQDLPQVDVTK